MDPEEERLKYSRNVYQTILRWYENADTKANILLTLDGALVGFLTSSIFIKKEDLDPIIEVFGAPEWRGLSIMALTLTLSIVAALGCLWSRIRLPRRITELIRQDNKSDPYSPELILFFGFIRKLDSERFHQTLGK